ncbi:hypothetical protein HOB10_01750 [Candidatus Parcubacteria bacterium]|jgi:hypothetical protein|nr:hypothetical protein [Candidatus Parcubacteria bacterium]
MSWKKVLFITLVLGFLLQGIASLSYTSMKSESLTFLLTHCIIDGCSVSDSNSPCMPTIGCVDYLSLGLPSYFKEDRGMIPSPGFNAQFFLINIIAWHGLALLIVLPFSRKKKKIVGHHH